MATSKSKPPGEVMPSVSAAAVMSFLKDTRGLLTWATRDLAETLDIPVSEAAKVIPIMEMQGYVKAAAGAEEFFRGFYVALHFHNSDYLGRLACGNVERFGKIAGRPVQQASRVFQKTHHRRGRD